MDRLQPGALAQYWLGGAGADQCQWPCGDRPRPAPGGILIAESAGGPLGVDQPGASAAASPGPAATDGWPTPRPTRRTPPAELETAAAPGSTLVLLELVLVLGGVVLIQSLSWALGRWRTALAGLSVLLRGVVLLSWLFSQTLALPLLVHKRCRALQAMDHSRRWCTAMGSRCWGCCSASIFWG